MKTILTIIFLGLTICCNAQGYGKPKPRPIVKDSIKTVGNNMYLVLVDSAWQLCRSGKILPPTYSGEAGYTGSYTLFYPNYVVGSKLYIKQTFEVVRGVIVKMSKVQPFPIDGNPNDTLEYKYVKPVDVYLESKDKKATDTLLTK